MSKLYLVTGAARDAQMKEVDVHKMANFVYGHLPANKEPKLRDIEQTIQDFIKQEGQ